MNDAAPKTSSPSATAKRNAARLMAVQAVYQMAVNRKEPVFVVDEYLFLRTNMEVDGEMLVEPDGVLFKNIVLGVSERLDDLKNIVSSNRPRKEGQVHADEPLLEAVLLCGSYELLAHHDVDSPVIISSYVDVAKAFFEGGEPGLINGVLDSIGKIMRA
jgi:N utilization substance protein B